MNLLKSNHLILLVLRLFSYLPMWPCILFLVLTVIGNFPKLFVLEDFSWRCPFIGDLRCICFWLKKYVLALRGRPKLQSLHYQSKHLRRMLFERHNLLLWSIMPNFCCAFGCSNKTKTGSKSNISYYRAPFGTDLESLFLRKKWIAARISAVVS